MFVRTAYRGRRLPLNITTRATLKTPSSRVGCVSKLSQLVTEKIFQENEWIKTCYSIGYENNSSIQNRVFYVKDEGLNQLSLVGEYKEKDFGARFQIRLTDESNNSLNWVAMRLNEKYQ